MLLISVVYGSVYIMRYNKNGSFLLRTKNAINHEVCIRKQSSKEASCHEDVCGEDLQCHTLTSAIDADEVVSCIPPTLYTRGEEHRYPMSRNVGESGPMAEKKNPECLESNTRHPICNLVSSVKGYPVLCAHVSKYSRKTISTLTF
jgi:hypothetical protein